MSIDVSSTAALPSDDPWFADEDIEKINYKTLIEQLHREYQHFGQRIPGLVIDYETSSTGSFTVNNDASDVDLDAWQPCGRSHRLTTGGRVLIELMAAIENLELQLNIDRRDPDGSVTSLGSLTISDSSGNLVPETGVIGLSEATVSNNGNAGNDRAVLEYSVKAKATSDPGKLSLWHVHEAVIDPAQFR